MKQLKKQRGNGQRCLFPLLCVESIEKYKRKENDENRQLCYNLPKEVERRKKTRCGF